QDAPALVTLEPHGTLLDALRDTLLEVDGPTAFEHAGGQRTSRRELEQGREVHRQGAFRSPRVALVQRCGKTLDGTGLPDLGAEGARQLTTGSRKDQIGLGPGRRRRPPGGASWRRAACPGTEPLPVQHVREIPEPFVAREKLAGVRAVVL